MNFFYFFRTAFKHISQRFVTVLCSSLVMAVCMVLVCSCILVAKNSDSFMQKMLEQNDFVVYLRSDLTQGEIDRVRQQLVDMEEVASVEFLSKDEGYRSLLDLMSGGSVDASILERLAERINIPDLGASFDVRLTDFELMDPAMVVARRIPGVEEVMGSPEIAQGFSSIKKLFQLFAVILGVVVGGITLFIVYSFIQMGLLSCRDEVDIMGIVGASPSFIRLPFLIEGAFLGLLGGTVGLFFQYGIHRMALYLLTISRVNSFLTIIPFRRMLLLLVPGFVAGGMLLGFVCALVALQWLMRPNSSFVR